MQGRHLCNRLRLSHQLCWWTEVKGTTGRKLRERRSGSCRQSRGRTGRIQRMRTSLGCTVLPRQVENGGSIVSLEHDVAPVDEVPNPESQGVQEVEEGWAAKEFIGQGLHCGKAKPDDEKLPAGQMTVTVSAGGREVEY